MGIRLVKRGVPGTIPVNRLQHGQLAEVVQWPGADEDQWMIGKVVQRSGNRIVVLGDIRWWDPNVDSDGRLVRVLDPGETIEITAY